MKKLLTPLLLLTIAALACSVQLTDPTPAPPNTSVPPTEMINAVTATPASTQAQRSTLPPRPTLPPPTAASPASTSSASRTVKIFLIALGDNGKSGKKIGCDNSVVGVDVSIAPTAAVLRAAIEALLAVKTRNYGQSGLITVLNQSNLKVENVNIRDGKAMIDLSGTLLIGGVCDNTRVQAQFEETAKQFETVKDVEVFINNKTLNSYLSGR